MRSRHLAVIVMIVASFMDLMDATVVNVALPSIRSHVHASPSALEWIIGGYTLAFAIVLITGGRLGDTYGRRRVFLIGVIGFTLTSLAAAVAPDADTLVVSRLLEGASAAVMVPQVLATTQALFTPRERAPIYGIIGAVSGLAAIAGPVVGGSLVSADLFGWAWRPVFLVNVPVGVLLVVATLVWVPESRSEHPPRLDVVGMVLVSSALGLLVYPLVEGRQKGWPTWIWVMLAAAPVVLAVFVAHQRRRQYRGGALVPMGLFGKRGFSAGVVTQFAFMGAMTGLFLTLALYLQLGLHFRAVDAGLTLLPFSIGAFVGSAFGVPLAAKLGKPMVVLGALLQAGAIVWARHVVHVHADALSAWDLIWPLALAGVGLGLFVIPLVDLALAEVDVAEAGAGSGVFNTFQQVGAALGVAVAGVVFFHHLGAAYRPGPLRHAFLDASWVSVSGYLLAAGAGILLPSSRAGAAHAAAELHEEPVPVPL